jgi:hypothetical protein
MIEKTNEYILTAMIAYEYSHFTYSTIALGSLLATLEEWKFSNFSAGLISLVIENGIPFDMDAVL